MKHIKRIPLRLLTALALIALLAVSPEPAATQVQSPGLQPLEKHYQAARAALTRGDTDNAKLELKLALQDNPLDAASHFLLASLLARQGEYDQAIVGLQRALTLHPTNHVALYNLGTLLLRRGEAFTASRLFENAILIRSDYILSYNNLAKSYFLAGLPELAVATYEEALRRDPSNAVARGNLARIATVAGAVEKPPVPGSEVRPAIDVLDLTSDYADDPNRMLEIDAIIFAVLGTKDENMGFNFLQSLKMNFNYFASDHNNAGFGYQAPGTVGVVTGLSQWGWLFSASAAYDVNIANASNERLSILARPHLTTLNGTPATFVVGGEIVFKTSGNIGGDIKPYPFGTTLNVTPTLRAPAKDGSPRVHVKVEAGRSNILALLSTDLNAPSGSATFSKVKVTSEAVLGLGQTLILGGLSQREQTTGRSGVPILRDIPILKYLFSREATSENQTSVIILLTPRDPAFMDEQNRKSTSEFIEMRRAFMLAKQGTAEDMRRFRERYPNSYEIPPNRFGSHFFMMKNSEIYRAVSGQDLASEDLDLDLELLGSTSKEK